MKVLSESDFRKGRFQNWGNKSKIVGMKIWTIWEQCFTIAFQF